MSSPGLPLQLWPHRIADSFGKTTQGLVVESLNVRTFYIQGEVAWKINGV